jgi:uncharacterized membrane protein (DUF373 family)
MVRKIVHQYFPRTYDKLLEFKQNKAIRRIVVPLAIYSFIFHLLIIFGINNFEFAKPLELIFTKNYSSAIYTPFSIVLLYEIFELVVVLPESLTIFMAKQFEISSLIVLRDVFKNISHFDSMAVTEKNMETFQIISYDIVVGLLLFFLVAVFLHINKNRKKSYSDLDVKRFINVKKTITVLLGHTLVALAIYSFIKWGMDIHHAISNGIEYHQPMKLVFFEDFFSIMIFTDIFLLVFSLMYTRSYPILFRNASFAISTILIKLSITSPRPINLGLAVMANIIGVLTVLIFIYYNTILQRKPR